MARSTAPAAASPSPDVFRVDGLDGLRAIAVTTVVIFHAFPVIMPGGFLGVDLFFVVSGFLITALLLRERASAGRIDLRGFWLRRARRLLPALLSVLLITTAVATLVGGELLLGLGQQLIGALTFSANWMLLGLGRDYFTETEPELFRHLWSLGVEEQFYLLWPLALLLLFRAPRWLRAGAVGLLAAGSMLAMALLVDPAAPSRVYYGTDTHAFGLLLGAILAIISESWPQRLLEWPRLPARALTVAGPVAVVALVALASILPSGSAITFQGGLAAVAVLTAIAIAALRVPDSRLARVLDVAPLAWIGKRSYAIYLWHWPLLVLGWAAFPGTPRIGWESVPLGVAAIAVTVALSAASYRLLEQPMRIEGVRVTLRRWGAALPGGRPVAVLATVALIAGSGVVAGAVVTQNPGIGQAEASIREGIAALEQVEPSPAAPASPDGSAGDDAAIPTAGERIVMVGDSVTLAAVPTLKERFPGIRIDAAVSRPLSEGVRILHRWRDEGKLREIVIVALGTNGPIADAELSEIRRIIGPDRSLILVTAQAPRDWIASVNKQLTRFAQAYRQVELANWYTAIQPHLDVLAPDHIHFGGAGARIFATVIEDALERLAELPPLRDSRDALIYPTPR